MATKTKRASGVNGKSAPQTADGAAGADWNTDPIFGLISSTHEARRRFLNAKFGGPKSERLCDEHCILQGIVEKTSPTTIEGVIEKVRYLLQDEVFDLNLGSTYAYEIKEILIESLIDPIIDLQIKRKKCFENFEDFIAHNKRNGGTAS